MSLSSDVGHKLLIAFMGTKPPPHILNWLQERPLGGITLFRYNNVENIGQVRALTAELQRAMAVSKQPRLLIGADQEGGQLNALGNELTSLPGNMALGATRSLDLAYQVGQVLGRECAALGVNVNYAPSCDVNSNPQNPVIGVRSFGEDAGLVAEMATAVSTGIQSAGVIAALKHFPGHGDTVGDSHHGIPVLAHDEARLWQVELRPFQAAINGGAKMLMSAHVAIPALNNGQVIPATLSRPILQGLLRQQLGFQGVVVSDAMDMGAIQQGAELTNDVLAATLAGIDMLLMTTDMQKQTRAYEALLNAWQQGAIPHTFFQQSIQRILDLKTWVAQQKQPDLSVVGCADHQKVAQAVAEKSVTLVRAEPGLLPLQLAPEARLAVIVPTYENLTPADTSEFEPHTLGDSLRQYHAHVAQFVVPQRPSQTDIAELRAQVAEYDLLIIGTIEASRNDAQAALVNALLATAVPLISVALRTPYDLIAYPQAKTFICTYSIQGPAMKALAAALFGKIPFQGQLPTQIPGLYPFGSAAAADGKHS